MLQVVVIYDSVTGNNERMAKMIAEGVNSIEGVEAQIYKIGTKFPVSILDNAKAIVVGSPSIYGNMSPKLDEFLTNLKHLSQAQKVLLTGKKGAVFGSYAWDGGWHTERMERKLLELGVELVTPALSVEERSEKLEIKIRREDLDQCRALGKTIARAVVTRK
jgi:flavorubredoxin